MTWTICRCNEYDKHIMMLVYNKFILFWAISLHIKNSTLIIKKKKNNKWKTWNISVKNIISNILFPLSFVNINFFWISAFVSILSLVYVCFHFKNIWNVYSQAKPINGWIHHKLFVWEIFCAKKKLKANITTKYPSFSLRIIIIIILQSGDIK